MLRKDQVIGCQLERPEEVRGDHRRQVVQIHLVVLRLLRYFQEESDNVYKDISIDARQQGTYFFEFGCSLGDGSVRQVTEPGIQRECAKGLTHVFQDLL